MWYYLDFFLLQKHDYRIVTSLSLAAWQVRETHWRLKGILASFPRYTGPFPRFNPIMTIWLLVPSRVFFCFTASVIKPYHIQKIETFFLHYLAFFLAFTPTSIYFRTCCALNQSVVFCPVISLSSNLAVLSRWWSSSSLARYCSVSALNLSSPLVSKCRHGTASRSVFQAHI